MSKLSPSDYNLRIQVVQIVGSLLKKKLFETERDCLFYVLFKSKVVGKDVETGFDTNIEQSFGKIYNTYRQFKKQISENDIQAEFQKLEGQADYDFLMEKG